MNSRARIAVASLLVLSCAPLACDRASSPSPSSPSPGAPTSADPSLKATSAGSASPSAAASSTETASTAVGSAASSAPQATAAQSSAKSREAWRALVEGLSEPDASFFSDNIISNETSYLQVAAPLAAKAKAGGVYIGVGPEQNFTYIAQTRPKLAFIVDIRRPNMLQHLLYKAIFEEATSRAHFLASLLARPYDGAGDPGPGASIEAVMAHAEKAPPDESTYAKTHARLLDRIEGDYKIALSETDKKNLELIHRAFYKGQLDVRFELKEKNGRKYPSLRELLGASDPEGKKSGFLASEESFRLIQRMEREDKIVPVVGDFAGDKAMPGVAAYVKGQNLVVSAFYVSNVEQYLFENNVWQKWSRNIAALPIDGESLFIRAYLDQGRKHPSEMKGHRTATVLQTIAGFNARQKNKPFANFWSVTTEGIL